MNNIGIISGEGDLPIYIGKHIIKKGFNVCFFCIKNFTDIDDYSSFENEQIDISSFSKILKVLKKRKIDQIIMIGKIKRPAIKDIKFDLKTISLIKEYFLESKGDDQLLKLISKFFLKNGFPLFNWKHHCDELFSSKDLLTIAKPSKEAINNKNKGLDIFKIIGKSDIGQSIVIQNQLVLGIECLEGTDELIKRCSFYKKLGDRGILLKLSKYKQHNELDLPTIGLKTLNLITKYKFEGIFIEKNKCIIVEKEKVIDYCNKNNLFLSTVNKIE